MILVKPTTVHTQTVTADDDRRALLDDRTNGKCYPVTADDDSRALLDDSTNGKCYPVTADDDSRALLDDSTNGVKVLSYNSQ
jgi:hypothetical protein